MRRMDAAARQDAEAQLLHWFYEMDRAAGQATPAPSNSRTPSRASRSRTLFDMLDGATPRSAAARRKLR